MSLIQQLTTKSMRVMEQSLSLRTRRHKLLVGNLANLNTPGYKAMDLKFEDSLKNAMGKGNSTSLSRTHPRHLGTANHLNERIEGTLVASPTPGGRGDSNAVDIEYQMSRLMENQLLYSASTQMIRKMFRGLSDTITQAGAIR